MRSTRIHHFASRLHKWLALIIGLQLLIWFASGALMSFLPIEEVRGEHLVQRDFAVPLPRVGLVDPDQILSQSGGETISFRMLAGRPVAEVRSGETVRLFDGITAAPLGQITGDQALAIARSAWKGEAKPAAKLSRISANSTEYRGALPAWQVAFADPDETRVFIAGDTGRIAAVRTGTWRLYDFFWGLHIMDWKDHENFNSPWLLAFALGGLVLGLAGTVLLLSRWPIRRRRRRADPALPD